MQQKSGSIMEYRLFIDTEADNDLAKALKDRLPHLGASTGFTHQGISYVTSAYGVSVKIEGYITEIPEMFQGLVKKITLKVYPPQGETAPAGTYVRRGLTATVEQISGSTTDCQIFVTGTELGRVNRLMNDIRTGKASAAHRQKWGTVPATSQQ